MTLDKISLNIKVQRTKSQLNQEQVSSLLGVSRQTYIEYEKTGKLSTDTLVKLANIFKCNINDFFIQ